MKRIFTIIGARPQFIQASGVSRAIQQTAGIEEIMLHTGQHFGANMSDIFFNQDSEYIYGGGNTSQKIIDSLI